MKQIKLISLTYRYFKGLAEFRLDADGENTDVFGDNATGKTTLFDGFTWLLFGKDSANKADFAIKTLDKQGRELHNLDHEVEGVLTVDGRRRSFRRVYKEKYTKRRGSATADFTGHTTDFFVDGVPVNQKEYSEEVAAIIAEDAFKLLTNPAYFNEVMKWQDRRRLLLDICGDLTDAEVIASNKELAPLTAILDGRTTDKHRAMVQAQMRKINDELKALPVRIDEARRSLPGLSGRSEADIQAALDAKRADIADKEAEQQRIAGGGEIAVKEARLREIEGELLRIKNDVQADALELVAAKRREAADLRRKAEDTDTELATLRRRIQSHTATIDDLTAEADRLRAEWTRVNGEKFVLEHHEDTCAACGQSLPEDQVKAAHDKALAEHNRQRADRLEVISKRGRAAAGDAKRLQEERDGFERTTEQLTELRSGQWAAVEAAERELTALQASVQDVSADPAYIAKQQEADAVRAEILGLRSSVQTTLDRVRSELARLRTEADALERDKALFAQARRTEARIAELTEQEQQLAAEYERLQYELHLTDVFVTTKVAALESKINSKFRLARFKLFDMQVNGGIVEVCETLVDGVPYNSLNHAAKVQVGMDIIATLQDYYRVSAPIWIDNRESIVKLPEMDCQVISLIVSDRDKQLRVERGQMREAV